MDHAERSNNKSSQPFYHTQNETTLSSRKNHEATVSHEADSKRPLVLSVHIENKMTSKISGLGRFIDGFLFEISSVAEPYDF